MIAGKIICSENSRNETEFFFSEKKQLVAVALWI